MHGGSAWHRAETKARLPPNGAAATRLPTIYCMILMMPPCNYCTNGQHSKAAYAKILPTTTHPPMPGLTCSELARCKRHTSCYIPSNYRSALRTRPTAADHCSTLTHTQNARAVPITRHCILLHSQQLVPPDGNTPLTTVPALTQNARSYSAYWRGPRLLIYHHMCALHPAIVTTINQRLCPCKP